MTRLDSSFGHFAGDGKKLVATQVNTPRARMSYAWTRLFIAPVGQHVGGDAVDADALPNAIVTAAEFHEATSDKGVGNEF